MTGKGEGTKGSRLTCPRSGTELADRLHMGMSLSEALGEEPLSSGGPATTTPHAPGQRRSWIFAALLCISLLGWPVAWHSAQRVERADAKADAKESLAIEFEELAQRERAHASRVENELGMVREQQDVLDSKQQAIVRTMLDLNTMLFELAEASQMAIDNGNMEDALIYFYAFCAQISDNPELFEDQIDDFVEQIRSIIESVDTPSSPRG